MLHNWQKQIEKYVPDNLPGYDFVCRVPVFIPIREISLVVWERKVQGLTFVQECVLTAISAGTRSLADLAAQFGVPESIMLQIVAQLDTEQLAAISAGSIVLTEMGKRVLQSQKKVKIVRNNFSHIFINQITGDISDTPIAGVFKEPPRRQAYLQEVYPITLEFLRGHFDTLAAIYRDNRLANTEPHARIIEEAELYRILDISYQSLSYVRDYCFVYINQEDRSLAFRFHSGVQAYADALLEQINCHQSGAWSLLLRPRRQCIAGGNAEQFPTRLLAALSMSARQEERLAAVEEAYYRDRPLLDGEIEDILQNCSDFKPERILIEAPYLEDFLTETTIRALLSSHAKELVIHYSEDDRNAGKVLSTIKKLAKGQSDCKITPHSAPSISSVKMYFGDACAIQAYYQSEETVYHCYLYKLRANVTFDSARIKELWREISF